MCRSSSVAIETSWSGRSTGSGLKRKALMIVKMLALALMPRASVRMAAAVKPGVRPSVRIA